jgi:3-oxoacyl-(acyl-carrier-protein) synthase
VIVLSSSTSHSSEVAELQMKPALRKASKKMMLALAACERAIASSGIEDVSRGALILNSGFGEIEATGGFLKAFEETKVARPLLFQNSLHNSTTGFLAIHFGIQGPLFTVNHRSEGGSQALGIASTLLDEGLCDHCVVVSVESVPPEFAVEDVGLEGAAALVVAKSGRAKVEAAVVSEEMARIEHHDLPLKGLRSLLAFDAVYRLALK